MDELVDSLVIQGFLRPRECSVWRVRPVGSLSEEGFLHWGESLVWKVKPVGSLLVMESLHWDASLDLMGTPNAFADVPSSVLRTGRKYTPVDGFL